MFIAIPDPNKPTLLSTHQMRKRQPGPGRERNYDRKRPQIPAYLLTTAAANPSKPFPFHKTIHAMFVFCNNIQADVMPSSSIG
jgi:hypothetical protein